MEVTKSSNELPDFFNPTSMQELLDYFGQLRRFDMKHSNKLELAEIYVDKSTDLSQNTQQVVTSPTDAAQSLSNHARYESMNQLLEKAAWYMKETEFLTIGNNRELVGGVMVIIEKVLKTALEDIKTSEEYHGVETSNEWKDAVKSMQKFHKEASQALDDISRGPLLG